MRRRFGEVDCVVTGHLHMPSHRMVRGALLFSPGAVYVPEHDPDFDWRGPAGRGLPPLPRAPARRGARARAWASSRSGRRVTAERVPLHRPILAARRSGPGSRVTRPSATYQSTVRRSDSSMGV